MTTDKDLRDKLLRQDEASQQMADDFRNRILKADQARIASLRWLVLIAWALLAGGMLAAIIARRSLTDIGGLDPQAVWVLTRVLEGLFVVATLLTIWLHVRSRALTMRQIQTSLAQIEEHLRKMAQED
ncbi:MAG: hypothetical protein KBE65_00290 [Phycisphaerae bacterium]|nr:hypothetical protein [Phycisphaerae bacterium]